MGSWFKRQPTVWEQASRFRKLWIGTHAIWNTAWGRQPCMACAYDACEIVDATHTDFRLSGTVIGPSRTSRVEDITWYCDYHARVRATPDRRRSIRTILTSEAAVEAFLGVEDVMES